MHTNKAKLPFIYTVPASEGGGYKFWDVAGAVIKNPGICAAWYLGQQCALDYLAAVFADSPEPGLALHRAGMIENILLQMRGGSARGDADQIARGMVRVMAILAERAARTSPKFVQELQAELLKERTYSSARIIRKSVERRKAKRAAPKFDKAA